MTAILSTITRLPVIVLLSIGLAACGGGGGGGTGFTPTPTPAPAPTPTPTPTPTPIPTPIAIVPDFNLYTAADFPVGVAVSAAGENLSIFTASDASARQDLVVEHFSQLTAGNIMKMNYLHPQEDTFTFDDADQLVGFAEANGLTVHGHALVWHPSYQLPGFMNNYDGDFGAMLTEHVTTIVDHFATEFPDVVVSWDVVNEAIDQNEEDGWRRSVFYNELPPASADDIPNYIYIAFQAARDTDPDIDLYYNDYDNTARDDGSVRFDKTLQIAEALQDQDLIDGVGFQMHIYRSWPSVANFETAFQAVVDLGLKVKLTELDIPIFDPYTNPTPIDALTVELASEQRVRYCQVVRVYLDTVPAHLRGGITVWGLTDDESWLINQFANAFDGPLQVWPLLFNADLSAKPALQGFYDALSGLPCSS